MKVHTSARFKNDWTISSYFLISLEKKIRCVPAFDEYIPEHMDVLCTLKIFATFDFAISHFDIYKCVKTQIKNLNSNPKSKN